MTVKEKRREWWASLTGAKRERELAKQGSADQHHGRSDLACPACGTDSSTGCIAGTVAQ